MTTYTDLDLSFTRHPATGDVALKYDDEAIKQSVKTLIFLNFYDIPFRSYVGSNVLAQLFENFDPLTVTVLKDAVKEVLGNFEPRVSVIDVGVETDIDRNAINIIIVYLINNTLKPITQSIILERTR